MILVLKVAVILLILSNVATIMILRSIIKELKSWQMQAMTAQNKYQRLAAKYAPKE